MLCSLLTYIFIYTCSLYDKAYKYMLPCKQDWERLPQREVCSTSYSPMSEMDLNLTDICLHLCFRPVCLEWKHMKMLTVKPVDNMPEGTESTFSGRDWSAWKLQKSSGRGLRSPSSPQTNSVPCVSRDINITDTNLWLGSPWWRKDWQQTKLDLDKQQWTALLDKKALCLVANLKWIWINFHNVPMYMNDINICEREFTFIGTGVS